MTSRSQVLSRHVEPPPGSVVQVLDCPAEPARQRVMVVPAGHAMPGRSREHALRVAAAGLMIASVALLPRATETDDGDVLTAESSVVPAPRVVTVASSGGEVEAAASRSAGARFMAWEARFRDGGPTTDRRDVAQGIRLLADALRSATAAPGRVADGLSAMRWHGAQLERAGDAAGEPYADYADAGHVHAAFGHAARLLASLPDVPGGVEGELTAAADSVGPRPLAEQREAVRTFFRRAATVLAASAAP